MVRTAQHEIPELDDRSVERARIEQDDRLNAFFRRWPRLSRRELGELRHLHDERVRLARYVGRLRRHRSKRA